MNNNTYTMTKRVLAKYQNIARCAGCNKMIIEGEHMVRKTVNNHAVLRHLDCARKANIV